MFNIYMKSTTTLVITEIQIKTPIKHLLSPARMFNIKKAHKADKIDETGCHTLLRVSLHKWHNNFRKLVFPLKLCMLPHNDETIPL